MNLFSRCAVAALSTLALLATVAAPSLARRPHVVRSHVGQGAAAAHVFRLHPGDVLRLRLTTDGSAGLHWVFTHRPSRFAKIARVVRVRDLPPPAGSVPGARGERIVRTRALRRGRTRVELALVGADAGAPVVQRYRALLIVR